MRLLWDRILHAIWGHPEAECYSYDTDDRFSDTLGGLSFCRACQSVVSNLDLR